MQMCYYFEGEFLEEGAIGVSVLQEVEVSYSPHNVHNEVGLGSRRQLAFPFRTLQNTTGRSKTEHCS